MAGSSIEIGVFDTGEATDVNWPEPKTLPENYLYSKEQSEAPYSQDLIDSDFEDDLGLLLVPVAGPPGTPPKIVRVHAGYSTRRTDWTCERIGAKPHSLPDPATGDPHTILERKLVRTASPITVNGFDYVWRVSGSYYYVLDILRGKADAYPAGAVGAFTTAPELNWIDVTLFSLTPLRSPVTRGGG